MSSKKKGFGWLWFTGLPLGIILAYRLIPDRIRKLWSFGTSSSHLAAESPSWTSLFTYGAPHVGFKTESDKGPWGYYVTAGQGSRLMDWPKSPEVKMDTYGTGWPEGTPGRGSSVATMWDSRNSSGGFGKIFSRFLIGWVKLTFALPLLILGVAVKDQGWGGDPIKRRGF